MFRYLRLSLPRHRIWAGRHIDLTISPSYRRHFTTDDTDERFRHVNAALPRKVCNHDEPLIVASPKSESEEPPSSESSTKLDPDTLRSIPLETIEDALFKFVPEDIKSSSLEDGPLTPGQAFYLENRDILLDRLRRRYFEETTGSSSAPSDTEIESLLPLLMEEEKFGSYDPNPVVSPGKHHLWDYDTTNVSSTRRTIHLSKGQMPTLQQIVDILEQERIMNVSVVDMDSCNRRDQAMYCIVGTGTTRAHCRRVGRLIYRAIVDLEVPFVSETSYCCHSRSDEWIVARLGPLCVHLMVKEVRQKQR
ncbi:oligomerization domain, putative [Babesia ovis]|uniref:Oligomerization domain, putative n=1 Tax=Babesia ovis TaxID=5869 RepID=A0A9W5TBQ2_BABOV|nr:oligomerization domain, putative [Babesia ovis]